MAPRPASTDRPDSIDSFGTRRAVRLADAQHTLFSLRAAAQTWPAVERLPYTTKIVLENLLRHEDDATVGAEGIRELVEGPPAGRPAADVNIRPARILMQDFTGVPAIADLASLRDAVAARGGDVGRVRPRIPVDLVIDHSVTADVSGVPDARRRNEETELERNGERYEFLSWGRRAFPGLQVFPPGTGICHQVNLEQLAKVVMVTADGTAHPDTLVGTDSHTTMVNGLGVLGWGVGGIEAEAAMMGEPVPIAAPDVVGVELTGELRPGVTATDLVLTITELLRAHGVVGRFVEFAGPGVASLSAEARATVGNMSPEYGSTCAIFPIDDETLSYLRRTGRSEAHVALVEAYAKEQLLWGDGAVPDFSELINLHLPSVEPCIAGPSLPQQRVTLDGVPERYREAVPVMLGRAPTAGSSDGVVATDTRPLGVHRASADDASSLSFPASDPPALDASADAPGAAEDELELPEDPGEAVHEPVGVTLADGRRFELDHGHVVIAAITSCTNTSNPAVMLGAGLLARNAVARGLRMPPWVKTSLAPGSRVVMDYLSEAGLVEPLEALGFHLVGYGCTTCIGNSGALAPEISEAIRAQDLSVAAVLSGNRNFEGRINTDVRMNFLASPPLVVAFALAGRVEVDLTADPIGVDPDGRPVTLADIWPDDVEVADLVARYVRPEQFLAHAHDGGSEDREESADDPGSPWRDGSTYVRRPPFAESAGDPEPIGDITGARALLVLGDNITTDHISPAGAIAADSPAGRWLQEHGVPPGEFNSYGSRRGNHEVMLRGTFANPRLKNLLAPDRRGGWTRWLLDDDAGDLTVHEAARRYRNAGVPLVVLAGKEYGTGSSRDWAAKGTSLLGVRAVIARSFERIHRSNLVGMGVLPLELPAGETIETLGLDPTAEVAVTGLVDGDGIAREATARVGDVEFPVRVRVDSPREQAYIRHRGILPFVVDRLLAA
jgi:aconitate hydratase